MISLFAQAAILLKGNPTHPDLQAPINSFKLQDVFTRESGTAKGNSGVSASSSIEIAKNKPRPLLAYSQVTENVLFSTRNNHAAILDALGRS